MHNAQYGLDCENRAYYMTIAIQRWLSVRLDMLGNILILGIALFAAGFRMTVDPSKIGVVLSYTLSSTSLKPIGEAIANLPDCGSQSRKSSVSMICGPQEDDTDPFHSGSRIDLCPERAELQRRRTCEHIRYLHVRFANRFRYQVLYYTELPPEGAAHLPSDPPQSWPEKGAIQFREVDMSYREGLPLVLKGVSFEVKPGEKVTPLHCATC